MIGFMAHICMKYTWMSHGTHGWVMSHTNICDMTDSHEWVMSHTIYVWHDWFTGTCDVTSYLTVTCMTWHIHMWNITHTYATPSWSVTSHTNEWHDWAFSVCQKTSGVTYIDPCIVYYMTSRTNERHDWSFSVWNTENKWCHISRYSKLYDTTRLRG